MKMKAALALLAVTAATMAAPLMADAKEFKDVDSGQWYYSYVSEISDKGIMTGKDSAGTIFAPAESIPRAQFATVLYRMAGSPDVEYSAVFKDVPDGQWYTKPIMWAYQTGVANGYTDGSEKFGTADQITREQIAKMVYSYREYMEYDVSISKDLSQFPDGEKVSDFALEYVEWAVAENVITGKVDAVTGEKYLDPQASANRAEIAAMISRILVPFEGDYIIDAATAKSKIGDPNAVFVDSGSNPQKETIKGAIVTGWSAWSDNLNPTNSTTGVPGWWQMKSVEDMNEVFSNLGLSKDKEIILLGETINGWGDDARLMWQLRVAGYNNVKIVDGGYSALVAAGAQTQNGTSTLEKVDAGVTSKDLKHVVTTDELKANYDDYKIIDVRADEEYYCGQLYNEKDGGCLPGAIHLKYTDLFYADGTLRPVNELTKWFESAGLSKEDKIASYCTAGIRSSYMQVVLEMCGFENTYNYDESFWGWTETDGPLDKPTR